MGGGLCIHSNFSPHLLALPPPSQCFWASLTLLTSQIPPYFSNVKFNWRKARKQRTDLRQESRGGAVKSGFLDLYRQVSWVSRLHCTLGLWVISANSHCTAALIPAHVQCSHYGSPGLQVTLHLPNFNSHAALSDSVLHSSPFPEILSWPSGIQSLSTVKTPNFYLPMCSKENLALPKCFTGNWNPSIFNFKHPTLWLHTFLPALLS